MNILQTLDQVWLFKKLSKNNNKKENTKQEAVRKKIQPSLPLFQELI